MADDGKALDNYSSEHGELSADHPEGIGQEEGKTGEKPFPPDGLWLCDYHDDCFLDCGV